MKEVTLGARPFKDLVRNAIKDSGFTVAELAAALGCANPEQMQLYLDGRAKVPFPHALTFAAKIAVDPVFAARCWLHENFPQLLEFVDILPAPLLLTMNERRTIKHIRAFTEGSDAEVVVADGRDVVAVVMV